MEKNYKRVLGYALIMVISVLIIVLIACLSESRLENFQEQYQDNITINQKQVLELENKIERLEKENSKLKEKLEKNLTITSDVVTSQQALSDLKDIYQKYKAGKVAEARTDLDKIEPMGFDDATLSYYELLSDILKK